MTLGWSAGSRFKIFSNSSACVTCIPTADGVTHWPGGTVISFRNLLLYPFIQIPCAFPFEGFVIDDIIPSR
jgi:hypothetical protein